MRSAESLAAAVEDELARSLSDASVRAEPVEQIWIPDLEQPDTDLAIVKARYHLTHGVIASDLHLALSLVQTLCGGIGQPPPDLRPLTRLEMGVLDLVMAPVALLAAQEFQIGPVELGMHVTNAAALPDSKPEPGLAIPMQVAVGNVEGKITIGFTSGQLTEYNEEIDRRLAGRVAVKGSNLSEKTRAAIRPVPVDLIVGFEPMRVPAGQLAGLRVGDVLRTRQSVARHLVARVGAERIFHVRPAQQGQRLVAELIARIDTDKGTS